MEADKEINGTVVVEGKRARAKKRNGETQVSPPQPPAPVVPAAALLLSQHDSRDELGLTTFVRRMAGAAPRALSEWQAEFKKFMRR